MKKFSILAMVLAFTMMLSIVSFAAPAFKVADDAVIPEGVSVTADADSIDVSKTGATAGNYYGILLVEGTELPTAGDEIYYINQATAADTTVAFDVLPIIPEGNKDMTLYLSSNVAGDTLVAIPVAYGEEVVVPSNDYITSADTSKGTIKVDVANATAGNLNGKAIASLALNSEAYPSTGYVVKVVAADGSDVEGSAVYYSKERSKYVALIPGGVTDYKFEVIAAGTEGAVANEVIAKYGNLNEDASGVINAPDFAQFKKVYLGSTTDAKKVLLADVSGDGKVNAPDFAQFKKAFLGSTYTFAVTSK